MNRSETILSIKIDSTSNGEFVPVPDGRWLARAKHWAAERIADNARRTGLDRRQFLTGLCGAATTLLTFNQASAVRGNIGGFFDLTGESAFDPAAAKQALGGEEFIFDIQTHMVETKGDWRNGPGKAFERFLAWMPQGACGEVDPVDCYSAQHFVKEVFLDSDTDMAVLSFVPVPPAYNSLSLKEADRTRALVQDLGGGRRLLLHAIVLPNLPPLARQLERMEEAVKDWPIAAFKVYTQWGPDGVGWALDDAAVGIPFLEKASALGVKNICIHKGFPLRRHGDKSINCADVGRAAKLFPEMNFIIYHSGFETARREGVFDANDAERGIDSLVKTVLDNDIATNANVYAELGSTWRFVMRDPTAAAHALGKLLRYVGQDNVLWGTDSIWYGSPQDQIQAFRTFQISEALQDKHAYPALSTALKAKVFGLNSAKVYGVDVPVARRRTEGDPVQRSRASYAEALAPSLATYGPRTARDFCRLQARQNGLP